MKDKWWYSIYKITWMEKGVIRSSHIIWSYGSLKEAREDCKRNHYSWPFYYILRKTKNGEKMYKP